MTVLVLTCDLDPTADLVINELTQRGTPLVRLDPGAFPAAVGLSARIDTDGWHGEINGRHRDVDLDKIRSVYYRRPSPHQVEARLPPADTEWSRQEARAAFSGVLDSLTCRWVNHPADNRRATNKPAGLAAAARCGLTIPRTLVTSQPEQAREFIRSVGGTAAYKPLAGAPVEHDGAPQVVWTSKVTVADITDAVTLTAHLFQEWINKAYEVRLTAVGNRLFAAEIHAHSDAARHDFRSDYDNLTYQVCDVPDTVADGIGRLLAAYRLQYAAMDFLVNQAGDWHMVDLNPNGQFGFVPDLRQPIAAALAGLLEGHPS